MSNYDNFKIDLCNGDNQTQNKYINNAYSKVKNMKSFVPNLYRQLCSSDRADTHNVNETKKKLSSSKSVVIEMFGGLKNKFVLLLLCMWYACSALTLFTNKYIISSRKTDPTLIGNIFHDLHVRKSISTTLVK